MLSTFMDSFSPLRNSNFRTYMGGQGVSALGSWMQATAQAWVVWRLTGSTVSLGIVAMLNALPTLLLGPFTGVWADRLDRRRVLVCTNMTAMTLAVIMGVLVHTGAVLLWHVFVLAGLLGCIGALDTPSQQAFIGDLAGVTQVRKGIVLNAMVGQVGRMIGPAVAGWMIGMIGEGPAFWLNGLSYCAVIASLLAVSATQERQLVSGNPLREFRDGLGFVRTQPRIQDLILFTGMTTLFGVVNTQLFPAIATNVLHGGPETLGILMGAFGAGSFFSAMVLTPLLQRVRLTGLMLAGVLIWSGLCFTAFAFSNWLPFSLVAIFGAAFAQPVVLATVKGLLQVLAPPHMRARVLSLQVMIAIGMQPLSALAVGYAAQLLGSPPVIRTNGILMVTCAVLLLAARPALGLWDTQRANRPATGQAAAD